MNKIRDIAGKIFKRPINKKLIAFLSLMALLAVGSSATLAFLHEEPVVPLTNTFESAQQPTISIQEEFSDGSLSKKNVCVDVGNPGYTMYVRAAVVVTWKDGNGNVLGAVPEANTDYTIAYNNDGWFENAGFWYCKTPVTGTTPNLITTCTVNKAAPDDAYHLSVEIMAQSIQAAGTVNGTLAVTDAWNVKVAAGGSLVN